MGFSDSLVDFSDGRDERALVEYDEVTFGSVVNTNCYRGEINILIKCLSFQRSCLVLQLCMLKLLTS